MTSSVPSPGAPTPPDGGRVAVEHDGCDLCQECPGCDCGSGVTPERSVLDTSRPGVVSLVCADCKGRCFVCPTVTQ